MANGRKAYFRRTRKARMRGLKHSACGWCGFVFALVAIGLLGYSLLESYRMEGNAQLYVGIYGLLGFVCALAAVVLGALGVRQKQVRPTIPKSGLVLGILMSAACIALFVYGCI